MAEGVLRSMGITAMHDTSLRESERVKCVHDGRVDSGTSFWRNLSIVTF